MTKISKRSLGEIHQIWTVLIVTYIFRHRFKLWLVVLTMVTSLGWNHPCGPCEPESRPGLFARSTGCLCFLSLTFFLFLLLLLLRSGEGSNRPETEERIVKITSKVTGSTFNKLLTKFAKGRGGCPDLTNVSAIQRRVDSNWKSLSRVTLINH